jgi:hypothetical protein
MKDYSKRIENLRQRRQDPILKKTILSESFDKSTFGDSLKYVFESMKEIDPRYNSKNFDASNIVQDHLKTGLNKNNIEISFRHQGSLETNTNIKLHSDIDILVIIEKFVSLEPPQIPTSPYTGDPLKDLSDLRELSFRILYGIYNEVDNSKSKAITAKLTNPQRKVDIIPSNWWITNNYNQYKDEFYKGIRLYDKKKNIRINDLPFLHSYRINYKDNEVGGGLKKIIRLLKTLKADSDVEIKLSSYEIQGIVYNMDKLSLTKSSNETLKLLLEINNYINLLINNQIYREGLMVPNGTELVFGSNTSKINELIKMKEELEEIIADLRQEIVPLHKSLEDQFVY